MEIRYDQNKRQAFILRPENLKKLINTLQNRELNLKNISIDCRDNISRKFNFLDDCLGYENAKGKEINSIHIHFESTDYNQRVSIHFMAETVWSFIGVSIDVSDSIFHNLKGEIDDVLSGMCSWYHFLTHPICSFLAGGSVVIIFFLFILIWFYKYIQTLFNIENGTYLMVMIPVLASWIGIANISIRIYHYFFPGGVFAIGQGASRFEFQQKVLKGIIGILVSILVGSVVKLVVS